MYDYKYLPTYSSSAPTVISVGNIVAGGTGKTPVVLLLAEELIKQSKIAILSSGYRSNMDQKSEPVILSNGSGPLFSAAECGDEPFLLARRIPKALIIVGKDRVKAAKMAVQAGAKILIVDDGFQHRRLQRNYDLVVMNGEDIFGRGHYLPRGFLRESPKTLERADLIILNHVKDESHAEKLTAQLRPYTKAPVVATQMQIKALQGEKTLQGKSVGLFCAIAHPELFERTVEKMGAKVLKSWILPDHAEINREVLREFIGECRSLGAEAIVCTEKDQVKIDGYGEFDLPIIWPEMSLSIVSGESHWQAFINSVSSQRSQS